MITMEDYTSIQNLKLKGAGIKEISRLLKISKNTVKKYLNNPELPTYHIQKNPTTNDKDFQLIDPSKSEWELYKNQIIDMYYNKHFIGSRIFNELIKLGAKGSRTGFYAFYRKIKNTDTAKKARARFETGPGKQDQFDWSDYTVPIAGEIRKVYVFMTTLCYSRYKHLIGSFDKLQTSIFESKELAYEYFEGVTEESLMDNAAQMVKNASRKDFRWNDQFLKFMDYYGVNPKACKVKHSWTKGKVENPFRYLEEQFIKGNDFTSLDDFNEKLSKFVYEWNRKHHQGINRIPYEMYLKEKEYLKPLPKTRFIGVKEIFRKVYNDCLMSFEGNKYSVPNKYAFKHVWIKKHLGDRLLIYSQKGFLIAKHAIPQGKKHIITNPEHYKSLIQTTPESNNNAQERFLEYFPQDEIFIEKISASKRHYWKNHIKKIIDLKKYYSIYNLRLAITSCITHNVFSYDYVYAFLTAKCDIQHNIKDEQLYLFNNDEVKRDLLYYEEVTNGTI
jgi:transposase